jgi:hypothetical protein
MTQVVSSISGIQVYAPSAGFAPTNSADVSAIASGYQVVSATATQLYAGTAYLTSVNDAPVSASRAGQAANAGMANSAYYDGTGRLISSLPDEATVSSIASSYAESAASGKLDTTAQVVTSTSSASGLYYDYSGNLSSYTAINALNGSALSAIASLSAERAVVSTNASHATSAEVASFDENYRELTAMAMSSDVSGVIDTVSANSASWGQAGVDSATVSAIASAYVESGVSGKLDSTAFNSSDFYTTANESGFVDSAYVDGQVSGKLDSTAFNSADFYGTGNESGFVDSGYVDSAVSGKQDSSAMSAYALSSDVSGVIDTVSSNSASWGQGGTTGDYISAKGLEQAITNAAGTSAIAFGSLGKPGIFLSGEFGTAYYKDNELNLNRNGMKIAFNIGGQGPKISSMATGTLHSYMYLFASGKNSGTYSDTGIEFKDSGNNTVALYDSATYGKITSVHDTVSANSATWGAGATGDYVEKSATVVAIGSINDAALFSFAQGISNNASSQSFAQGGGNSAQSTSFAHGYRNEADSTSFAQGERNSVSSTSFAQGYYNTASACSFTQGQYNSATNTAAVFGQYNLRGDGDTSTGNSAAFAIGDGTADGSRHDLMLVTKNGEITMYSSTADTVGTGIMSSIRGLSATLGDVSTALAAL